MQNFLVGITYNSKHLETFKMPNNESFDYFLIVNLYSGTLYLIKL